MYTHVLVPIALDHNPHNAEAMTIAAALAGTEGKITLLNVMELMPAYIDQRVASDFKTESLARARDELKELAASTPRAQAVVEHGHAAQTILEYAEKHDADCIVIASHKPGLQDYFIGSTAARVVRHAGCSVHVVR